MAKVHSINRIQLSPYVTTLYFGPMLQVVLRCGSMNNSHFGLKLSGLITKVVLNKTL